MCYCDEFMRCGQARDPYHGSCNWKGRFHECWTSAWGDIYFDPVRIAPCSRYIIVGTLTKRIPRI